MRLLELIGDARTPLALPVLVEQLDGDDDALRSWAVRGLRLLDFRDARYALSQAQRNGVSIEP
jgi:hypothetical protein